VDVRASILSFDVIHSTSCCAWFQDKLTVWVIVGSGARVHGEGVSRLGTSRSVHDCGPVRAFDVLRRSPGRTILPSLVFVCSIAPNCIMSIRVSAQVVIAKTLVGVSCTFTPHFHAFPFHSLGCLPTLSMLMWVLCRPFLARPATDAQILTTTVASTIPRKIF